MTQDDENLLEREGWVVECQSPFEIRHTESGSFASGLAAQLVLQAVRAEQAPALNTATVTVLVEQFDKAVSALTAVCEQARAQGDEEAWKLAYAVVFSDQGSGRVRAVLDALNIGFDYYDPDTSYEEDVMAYVKALQDLHRQAQPILQALKAVD